MKLLLLTSAVLLMSVQVTVFIPEGWVETGLRTTARIGCLWHFGGAMCHDWHKR